MTRLARLETVDDVLGWFAVRGVAGLVADSRRVRAGDAFIAWPGYAVDGRAFVPQALAQGAAACLVEADGVDAFDGLDREAVGTFDGLKAATGEIASRWFGEPSRRLDLIAVTGTNGKTSTAWWVAQGLSQLGQRCGVIGTLGVGEPPAVSSVTIHHGAALVTAPAARVRVAVRAAAPVPAPDAAAPSAPTAAPAPGPVRDAAFPSVRDAGPGPVRTAATAPAPVRAEPVEALAHLQAPAAAFPIVPTGMTTPDPIVVQHTLKRFADAGFAACAIEATSIGLAEHRLAGARIGIALFTNFTQDHLDYHGSMAAYWQAKAQLFGWPGLRAAVVNVDDPRGAELAATLASSVATGSPAGGTIDLWTCSSRGAARLKASNIGYGEGERCGEAGLVFDLEEARGAEPPVRARVRTAIVGHFHVGNLLATLGALRASGVPLAEAAAACERLTPVPGRMQRVDAPPGVEGPAVVVDYAHTPDALEKALAALRPLATDRRGALWCVFGCGGDRDASKRPAMGRIAARLADRTVLTSDNPRREPPERIVEQIAAGWDGTAGTLERIVDRRAAIAHAIARAAAADVVLLAGKGHEDHQDIDGVRQPLSDAVEAVAALSRLAPAEAAGKAAR